MDYLAPSAARAEPFTYDEGAMLGGHSQEISAVHNTSEAAQRVGPGPGVAGAAQGASQSGVLASMLEHVGGHAAEHPAAAQHQRGFQSAVHNSALTDPQPSQAATAPLSAQQSAAGQQSPKAMLEMLRRKLDVFQTDTGRPNSQGSNSQGIAAAPPPVALAQPISAAVPAGGVVPAGLAVLSADPAVSEHYAAAMDRAPSAFAGHRTTAAHRASDSPPSGALDMMPRPGPAAGPSQERAGASTGCSPAVIETLAARIAAVEAQCTATIAGIRADLDRRLGTAISAFQAEDQVTPPRATLRAEHSFALRGKGRPMRSLRLKRPCVYPCSTGQAVCPGDQGRAARPAHQRARGKRLRRRRRRRQAWWGRRGSRRRIGGRPDSGCGADCGPAAWGRQADEESRGGRGADEGRRGQVRRGQGQVRGWGRRLGPGGH